MSISKRRPLARQIILFLAVGAVTVGAAWQGTAAHAQRAAGLNSVLTFQIGPATKTLDLGASGTPQYPTNWTQVGFDDSSWTPAATASVSCTTDWAQDYQNIGSPPIYWGDTPTDAYLFRLDFGLPAAKSYNASTLAIGAIASSFAEGSFYETKLIIYVNGHQVDEQYVDHSTHERYAIGTYLTAGSNVLAISTPLGASSDQSECGALAFTITARMTDVQTNTPAPKPSIMSVILPGQNAVLSGSSTLPFSWTRFSGASLYILQIWLVQPASGQAVTSRTVTTFTARLTGTRYSLSVRHMLKGVYHWRMVAADAHGRLISDWTPEQTVSLR